MIFESTFKNVKSVVLENDLIKVVVLPSIGGKISSIYNKANDFELLSQNKNDTYGRPKLNDNFPDFDASGFDDCFPTIDPSTVLYDGKDVLYPDHGEIWSADFYYEIIGDSLKLSYKSAILPYTYEKYISINSDDVIINYDIKNTGTSPFPCIWAMHCLVNNTEDMIISLPDGTSEIINVHDSGNLGKKDSIHQYPITKTPSNEAYDLRKVSAPSANKTEKYYVNGEVTKGYCSITYPSNNIIYGIEFDKDILPYVGLWISECGFNNDYNCALEPTNGFYDDIDTAKKYDKLFYLNPNLSLNFKIKIKLQSVK